MRHHHVTVELYPSNEASPRGLRGIIPLQEAPPRGLRGITPWPWGTTTTCAWNYVLMLRHHQGLLLRGSMGFGPPDEARPRISHYESHEITPYPHFIHVPSTNQEFPIGVISCINNKSYNSCFPIHIQQSNIPFPSQTHILPWHHHATPQVQQLDQTNKPPHSKLFNENTQTCPRSRPS